MTASKRNAVKWRYDRKRREHVARVGSVLVKVIAKRTLPPHASTYGYAAFIMGRAIMNLFGVKLATAKAAALDLLDLYECHTGGRK